MSEKPYVTLKQLQDYIAKYPPKSDAEKRKPGTDGTSTPSEKDGYSATTTGTPPPAHHWNKLSDDELAFYAPRITNYVAAKAPAVMGAGGSTQTMKVAAILVRGFNLTEDQAWPFIEVYNKNCDPPWSEHDLRRKLKEASKHPGTRGNLIKNELREMKIRLTPASLGRFIPKIRNYLVVEKESDGKSLLAKEGMKEDAILELFQEILPEWPKRAADQLFRPSKDGEPIEFIDDGTELMTWMSAVASEGEGEQRRQIDWEKGSTFCTEKGFYVHCINKCERYDSVERYPFVPVPEGVYCLPFETEGGDGSALSELVSLFSPETPEDEELIRAYLLTLFWGGPRATRPLFLFESSAMAPQGGRGAGKSTLAEVGAELCGCIDIDEDLDKKDVISCILDNGGRNSRIVRLDNLKSLRLSNASLERLITQSTINGKQMYIGQSYRPNYLTWVMTGNGLSLSKDLAQRAAVIRVISCETGENGRPYPVDYVQMHRKRIIGDIVAILSKPLPEGSDAWPVKFRWKVWIKEIVNRLVNPEAIQRLLIERAGGIDADDEQAEELIDAIRLLIMEKCGEHFELENNRVLIPNSVLVEDVLKKHLKHSANSCEYKKRFRLLINSRSYPDCKFKYSKGIVYIGADSPDLPNKESCNPWNMDIR